MTRADAPSVAALSGQLGYLASAAEIERRFDALAGWSDHAFLVIEDGSGAVAGFVHVAATPGLTHAPIAEILALVVDESARGAGFGARLVAAAEDWSRARGVALLRVRTRIARERAHAFYERLDFRRTKTQHVFDKDLSKGR